MEVQPQKEGMNEHPVIIKVNGNHLKHKAGNTLQFAHYLLAEILLLYTFSSNPIDLLTELKV